MLKSGGVLLQLTAAARAIKYKKEALVCTYIQELSVKGMKQGN